MRHKGADAFPVVIRSCTDGAFCYISVSAAAKIASCAIFWRSVHDGRLARNGARLQSSACVGISRLSR